MPVRLPVEGRSVTLVYTMLSMSTGSESVSLSRPRFKSNSVNSVNVGGVVSFITVRACVALTVSTRAWAGLPSKSLSPAPVSSAIDDV